MIALMPLAGCGVQTDPSPTPTATATATPLATRTEPTLTLTSSDGVRFVPGTKKPAAMELQPIPWHRIRFRDGSVTLSLAPEAAPEQVPCSVNHVEVGPADGVLRRVTVWGKRLNPPCPHGPKQIELSVPGWTRATIAAPDELDVPDASLTGSQQVVVVPGSAVLQPDRRSIVVGYTHSRCNALAKVTAKQNGPAVRVVVTVGTEPNPASTTCLSPGLYGHTLVRLPTPAPPRATVTVVRCGRDRQRCVSWLQSR
ncbi:hypothetical protein DVA67_032760 [Solirubrobacter sp. CPCC 204708]|uniref:Uncharacterized protein n=1 Tax=Solirubrobacter deserti TaxID=2282478 RepID=A0ABT4RUF0_9ACTN|nr:hypothetical protein [Solirubrobacter deserti]MBE2320777.1 hypothetical protein [Solirubrobacter deserti]MDA0141880.1 hypothetical protein [Solirubrobacter deserti]